MHEANVMRLRKGKKKTEAIRKGIDMNRILISAEMLEVRKLYNIYYIKTDIKSLCQIYYTYRHLSFIFPMIKNRLAC